MSVQFGSVDSDHLSRQVLLDGVSRSDLIIDYFMMSYVVRSSATTVRYCIVQDTAKHYLSLSERCNSINRSVPNQSMMSMKSEEEEKERWHFNEVCKSYQQYATFHQVKEQGMNRRRERLLSSSKVAAQSNGQPSVESIMQKSFPQDQIETNNQLFCKATIRNQFFLDSVLKHCGAMTSQEARRQQTKVEWATEDQISKVDSVLKSVYRDWSAGGREERSVVYEKLLGALDRHLPLRTDDSASNPPPKVAVPGSGLGRLAFEIYSKGYSSQGSDFSLPMLLASDFILNGCSGQDPHQQFAISPFLSETSNVKSLQDRLRTVIIPDVAAAEVSHDSDLKPDFSMLAGEFLSLYSHFLPGNSLDDDVIESGSNEKFNAVVCSYFIDTAPSLPHYLITIYHMLEKGGLFINFGPMMWHWTGHGTVIPDDVDVAETPFNQGDFISANHKHRTSHLDQRYLQSVDFTWEETRLMILNSGFEFLEEEFDISTRYTSDKLNMKKVQFDCIFFVARKVR